MAYMWYDDDDDDDNIVYIHSDESDISVDSVDWTNNQDSEENLLRSDAIGKIIYKDNQKSLGDLVRIVESGWDVNESLNLYEDYHKLGQRNRREEIDLLSYSINNSVFLVTDIVKLLLKHGANPNIAHRVGRGGRHRTALHEATRRGLTDVVKILLNAGATYTISDPTESPLPLALQCSHCPIDLIKLLLEQGEDPNYHKDNEGHPLTVGIHNTSNYNNARDRAHLSDIVQLLLEHGANPNMEEEEQEEKQREAGKRREEGDDKVVKWIHRTPIQEAVARGWTDGVKILLEAGADCRKLGTSENLLSLAVQKDNCHPDLIRLLLNHGADPNDHDEQFEHIPLMNTSDPSIIKLLLDHGANPNVVCDVDTDNRTESVQRTPLHIAVTRGQIEVVEMLLDAGAKFKSSTVIENPLALALQHSDYPLELIKLLLKHVDPNDHDGQLDNVPLLNAIKHSRSNEDATAIVELLLGAGAKCKMSAMSQNPLAMALQKIDCHPNIIELLLKHGADPNDHDDQCENIPLLNAIRNYKYNRHIYPVIIKLLLDHGANPNIICDVDLDDRGCKLVQRTPLHLAVTHGGQIEVVKILLDGGAKLKTSTPLENPLALAIQKNRCNPDLIELLLKHGADPNDHDDQFQNIPLMFAIANGIYGQPNFIDPSIIKLLLEHGANPNVVCNVETYQISVKRTPLYLASKQGQTDVVKMLLDSGANFKTSTALGNPLALALQNKDCDPDLIDLLLNHGTDPNDHDDQRQNIPLFQAILNGRDYRSQCASSNNKMFVQLLLHHGANPSVSYRMDMESSPGGKPLYITAVGEAARQGWTEGLKILLDAGAKANSSAQLEATRNCSSQGVQTPWDGDSVCKIAGTLVNPLALALQENNCPSDLVKLLLSHGADPNDHIDQFDYIPLMNAIVNGEDTKVQSDPPIIQLLLDHGANPNVEHSVKTGGSACVKYTALQEAARRGLTDDVKVLLNAGAKITSSDPSLGLALQDPYCEADLIELLLKNGADPNQHTNNKNVPLTSAIHNVIDSSDGTKIVHVLLEHGANPNVKHRLNIGSYEEKWVERTAIQEAAARGWTNVVRVLLKAGATCAIADPSENALALALQHHNCDPDLIEMLLTNGVDLNQHEEDRNIPLTCAIHNVTNTERRTKIVQLLLENGANPNVLELFKVGGPYNEKLVYRTPIHEATLWGWAEGVKMLLGAEATCRTDCKLENPLKVALELDQDCKLENPLKVALELDQEVPPDLIELLLRHCAEVNYNVHLSELPALHRLADYVIEGETMFFQKHLDLFFQQGGNVHTEDSYQRTSLEYAITERGHNNTVRWLIRHGADTTLGLTLFSDYFTQSYDLSRCRDTPLILLKAGMRISHVAFTQLNNMEVAISTQSQQDAGYDPVLGRKIDRIWNQIERAERGKENRVQRKAKKLTFPEYLTQQMSDLEAFSDRSLHIYPEDTVISSTNDLIHQIVGFLSQPQALQWHCRRCVRENLVSLQPSVLNLESLSIPKSLKRYILCHDL